MPDNNEINYSDQGRFKGAVKCGAPEHTFWARTEQPDPEATAQWHNDVAHGGLLVVRRVESAEA